MRHARATFKMRREGQKKGIRSRQTRLIELHLSGVDRESTSSSHQQQMSDPANLSVTRSIFQVESGSATTAVAQQKKSCTATIKLSHPAGWQFSVSKADYYGRVKLAKGVEVFSKSFYTYTGTSAAVSKQYYFDGPFDGSYMRNDRWTGTTGRTWTSCGSSGTVNITSEITIQPQGGAVAMKNSSIEIFNFLGNRVGLDWKKC